MKVSNSNLMKKIIFAYILFSICLFAKTDWYSTQCINKSLKDFGVEESIDEIPSLLDMVNKNKSSIDNHIFRSKDVKEDFEYIKNELIENDLPISIAYICFAESNFYKKARGYNTAGVWQLTNATATKLGLKISKKNDERLDIKKSTKAVIKLWKRLLTKYEKLYLADFAFGLGEGGLQKAINTAGSKNFIKLWKSKRISHGMKAHFVKLILLDCAFSNQD